MNLHVQILLNGFEIVTLFFIISSTYKSDKTCILNSTADGSIVCCTNYYKDKNDECNTCAPGYFGDNCEEMCPNGSFGDNCGGTCSPDCGSEECDPVTGCPNANQNRSPVTVIAAPITITPYTNSSKATERTSSISENVKEDDSNISQKFIIIIGSIITGILTLLIVVQLLKLIINYFKNIQLKETYAGTKEEYSEIQEISLNMDKIKT